MPFVTAVHSTGDDDLTLGGVCPESRPRAHPATRMIGRLFTWLHRLDWFTAGSLTEWHLRRVARGFGRGSRINGRCEISGARSLEIGRNVHVGHGALIRAEGGVYIGDNTHIARHLILYSVSHQYEGSRLPYDESVRSRPVTVGRNVWIGVRVTILPGASIGDGAIVGAGAVVSGVVEPLSIVGASVAGGLGSRNADHYRLLDEAQQYGGIGGRSTF